jgi:hypothetical protein
MNSLPNQKVYPCAGALYWEFCCESSRIEKLLSITPELSSTGEATPATTLPDGQIKKFVSSPVSKNIALPKQLKSIL